MSQRDIKNISLLETAVSFIDVVIVYNSWNVTRECLCVNKYTMTKRPNNGKQKYVCVCFRLLLSLFVQRVFVHCVSGHSVKSHVYCPPSNVICILRRYTIFKSTAISFGRSDTMEQRNCSNTNETQSKTCKKHIGKQQTRQAVNKDVNAPKLSVFFRPRLLLKQDA